MNINIGDKDYNLIFGLKAIDYLDHVYTYDILGVPFGSGVRSLSLYLSDQNPMAIYYAIKAATITESQKPSDKDIESYLSEQANAGKLEAVFDDFLSLLANQPLTKDLTQKVTMTLGKLAKEAVTTTKKK